MKQLLKPGIHWFFVFIPVTIVLDYSHASSPLIFFSAALSIIPIAHLIGLSTEQLASYTGDAIGGLLNAIVALKAGLYEMLLASLAGAIIGNMLLAMGVSFLIGGLKFHNQEYNPTSIRMYSSMMMVAVISLMVPSAFHHFFGTSLLTETENTLNIGLSIILLVAYGLYLVFMLKTHPDFFRSKNNEKAEEVKEERWSMKRAIISLVIASLLAAFMSEILVGAAEETGKILGMSSVFIGVIFLAIIGGAAESISAVTMASKGKMDLSIGILLGSSIQVALFVAPLLVLLSLVVGPGQMNLAFSRMLIIILFLCVLLGALIAGDGRSNWYKGVQLIIMYLIISMMIFLLPVAA